MDNRLLAFARLARTIAERTLPERAHKFAPKRYTQPQLLACLLIKEYLGLDYRTAQEALELSDGLRGALGLSVVPDYSTLWRFAHDKATQEVVARALAETVALLQEAVKSGPDPPGADRPLIAVDSTGLLTGHASRYFEHRARRDRRQRSYQKWAVALWTQPQLVLAQLSKRGPAGDYPDLPPLTRAAAEVISPGLVVADAGYDCEANHRHCREQLGVMALIPARTRRYVAISRTPYRMEMARLLGCERLGEAGDANRQRAYRQRWKVETLMSVVKRRWGEALTARSEMMQRAQTLLRGLVYNIYRLAILGVRPATA
jgi:hypothetical protein